MLFLLFSCGASRKTATSPLQRQLEDSVFAHAHMGFSLYDPSTGTFLVNRQGDRYFVPASNTKIISCYAGMKYLGDRLKGLEWIDLDTAVLLLPTGDPTFLHPDYTSQPVADFIRSLNKPVYITDIAWTSNALGSGWSWDDYSAYYMAERSPMPVYGNVVRWYQETGRKENPAYPGDTLDVFVYSEPEVDWPVGFAPPESDGVFDVNRAREENRFTITQGRAPKASVEVPFLTRGLETAIGMLRDSLHREIRYMDTSLARSLVNAKPRQAVLTQPLDSMLRPMMHRSDNFFAEQTLLMSGYALLGSMNDRAAAERILQTDLKGMPHPPRWADGSGLSRYNLFTPMDFVWVLDKMQQEFGLDRIRAVFPTTGKGTLSAFLADRPGKVYAKTGTLSGVVALSGFVQARSGRWLVFSLMVNNHRQSARAVRQQMEAILRAAMDNY
jgi:D-alanyl-D-alanine carboxypeptidase/D-alanyl-D-alanine-endopeptidase (penicillin-binding protein 4)